MIDRGKVSPLPDNLVEFVSKTPLTFDVRGAVWNPDDSVETLLYYWFMDYPDSQGPAFLQGMGGKATFQLDPCSEYIFQDVGGEHYLELIVTDGTVDYDAQARKRIIQGGYAYVSWWLDVGNVCTK